MNIQVQTPPATFPNIQVQTPPATFPNIQVQTPPATFPNIQVQTPQLLFRIFKSRPLQLLFRIFKSRPLQLLFLPRQCSNNEASPYNCFWTILLYMCACVVKITELSIGIFRVSSRWRTCVSHWSYLQFFCENISTPFYLFVIDTQLWERIFHGDEMEIRCAEMSNFMSLLSLYTCRITQCTFELVLMGRLSVAT